MTEAVKTDRVVAGDHACLTFTDNEERLDLVAAFVRDGLRAGLKVVCWTDAISPEGLAGQLATRSVQPRSALRRGQLTIRPANETSSESSINAGEMIESLAAEIHAAGREGYGGVRVTVDMGWATGPAAAPDELTIFEDQVGRLFPDGQLCVICQYDRDRFDAVTLAFAAKVHPKTVAALVYYEHPLLRICRQYSPPGIRVSGQLDFRHRDEFAQALSESMRLDRHLRVNLSGLEYMDGSCAALILATASRLPASRRMTVTCRRSVAKVLSVVEAHELPRLRVDIVS
jgi:anti-anti-sigma factor